MKSHFSSLEMPLPAGCACSGQVQLKPAPLGAQAPTHTGSYPCQ